MSIPRIDAAIPQITLRGEGALGAPSTSPIGGAGPTFEGVISRAISEANDAQRVADQKEIALANGLSDDLHGTMISVKEAEISLKLVGSVRNKLLDAFHELWRTSV